MASETRGSDSKFILLVEDDPHIRRCVTEMLVQEGYNVFGVGSAESAMKLGIRKYDLLVTDIRLPGIRGWEFASWFDVQCAGKTNILFISADVSDDARFRRYRCRTEFLSKPFRREELLEAVTSLLYVARLYPEEAYEERGYEEPERGTA